MADQDWTNELNQALDRHLQNNNVVTHAETQDINDHSQFSVNMMPRLKGEDYERVEDGQSPQSRLSDLNQNNSRIQKTIAASIVQNPANRTINGDAQVPQSFKVNMVLKQTMMKRLDIQK